MMKPENIQNALGNIGDDLIEKAGNAKRKRLHRKLKWIPIVAAALAAVILIGVFLRPENDPFFHDSAHPYAILSAQYPSPAPYPNQALYGTDEYKRMDLAWTAERTEKRQLFDSLSIDLDSFFISTVQEILTDANGENKVYSPLNVYLALAMLAEITDGSSRQQILELLDVDNIETLRSQINVLWRSHYSNDGRYTLTLANSMWFNEDIEYNNETIKVLAEKYFASSFQGAVGNEEYNQALRDWLNEQTGGLLKDRIDSVKLDPEMVIALVSTIYFQAKWQDEFSEQKNENGTFYTQNGEVSCVFMTRTNFDDYYRGEIFSAVKCDFERYNSGMWLILPDEGVDMDALLNNQELNEFLKDPDAKSTTHKVNLFLPKFDITCESQLNETLKELGVTDIFGEDADFSSLMQNSDGVEVSEINHNVRITIDEEGCTAAAYTIMMSHITSSPDYEEVTVKLDRPFLFLVTSIYDTPLFTGVVNDPTAS